MVTSTVWHDGQRPLCRRKRLWDQELPFAGDWYQAAYFAFDTGLLKFRVHHAITDQDGSFAILQKVITANRC